MLYVANTPRHFFTSTLWIESGTWCMGHSYFRYQNVVQCPLAASEVTVPLQLRTENGPCLRGFVY